LGKGLLVVSEGQRINLRVYRRFFYPIKKTYSGVDYIVYSDTRRQREINYEKTEEFGLDDPFTRIRLVKLARALNALECVKEQGIMECKVTICTNKELFGTDVNEINYIPFDPERLESLEERIKKERKKIDWRNRMKSSSGAK
jgi:hypothetical protein